MKTRWHREDLWAELEDIIESLEIGAFTCEEHEDGLHARKWEIIKLLQDDDGAIRFEPDFEPNAIEQ